MKLYISKPTFLKPQMKCKSHITLYGEQIDLISLYPHTIKNSYMCGIHDCAL